MTTKPMERADKMTEATPVEYHILCVDDDRGFLKSLELFLPQAINQAPPADIWYRFHFLDEPGEALDVVRDLAAANEPIAMIISDQKMPRMKGTELFVQVQQVCEDCTRVLLTGHAGIESAIAAINDRLLDKYLTKPIEDERDFTVSIQHLLQRFHMRETLTEQEQFIRSLYEFANTLNRLENFQEMLDYVASFAEETLQCRRASILLRDDDRFRVVAGTNSTKNDAQGAPSPNGSAAKTQLFSGDIPLGVIEVDGKDGNRPFNELDLEMLTYIANTASIALHNQLNRAGLERAYVEAKDQAIALADANSRLQILDKLKMDFLDFIAHELRTPLSLMSAIDLFEKCDDATQKAEMIEIIRKGYERLDAFIKGGLDYFKWLATDRIATTEITDLTELVRTTAGSMPALRAEGVEFEISAPRDSCVVRGNAEHLREVVRTLLNNALKFSPNEKSIRVELKTEKGKVRMTVADRGAGFAPEWARELFLPFTITDTAHHSQGSAMNLAKASAIVKAHGGKIEATSGGAGKGATFTVELPAATEPVTAAASIGTTE